MFFKKNEGVLTEKDNRGVGADAPLNGSVRFSIFKDTVYFSQRD